MLNKEKHQLVMAQILKDIYSDTFLASLLGFKGGTAAFMFYDLPRFSVDLDFDLLEDSQENRELVFDKVKKIISKYGEIKDEKQKFATIFFSLSYEMGEHQIKVEINNRKTGASFEMLNYFGIPILVSKKDSMFSAKLVALINRKSFAPRDLFDVYFFLKNLWDTDNKVFLEYGITSEKEYIKKCVSYIEAIPENSLLKDLGELIDETQKDFVKTKIKQETIFLLKNRWQIKD
jgi:predicted nucleotidyltransferase component of viral defense system